MQLPEFVCFFVFFLLSPKAKMYLRLGKFRLVALTVVATRHSNSMPGTWETVPKEDYPTEGKAAESSSITKS